MTLEQPELFSTDGLRLEAVLEIPEDSRVSGRPAEPVPRVSGRPAEPVPRVSGGPAEPVPRVSGGPAEPVPRAVLVFCHPHPQMGGTMNAPLLLAVSEELVRRSWAVLRFNFRGIGSSEGEASTGSKEVADAEGAVAFARKRFPELPVAIAGWSFGAAVATRVAAKDDSLAALVAIAPAVNEKPGVTDGLPAPDQIELVIPTLVLCAVNDELVDVDDGRRWAEIAKVEFQAMPGANHFFWAKYDKLAAAVGDFLDAEV